MLCLILDAHDIELRPLYIHSAANCIADYASQLACSGDYHGDYMLVSTARFAALQAQWGACTVDAFASPATAQLPRFWTEFVHRGVRGRGRLRAGLAW